jgi:hypothetical protein
MFEGKPEFQDASLGAINAICLSMQVLAMHRVQILLNGYDATNELHRLNAEWPRKEDGLRIALSPRALLPDISAGPCTST